MIRSIVTQWNFVTCQTQEIKYSSLNILWTIKEKHNLLSLSFLFYERKLNTNLTFISGDFPFQGNYLIAITHTHTSSNVTVININKRNKTCCRRVLSKTLTPFYFRCFFLFRASLTKQHFISGLCHGITFWTTTNTNLHFVLVAFLAGTASQCYLQDVFFLLQEVSHHTSSA